MKQQSEQPPRLDEIEPSVPHGLATAVGQRAGDRLRRPPAGRAELGDMIAEGARGGDVEDATAATSILADTAATGLLRSDTEATQAISPRAAEPPPASRRRQPRQGEPRPAAAAARRAAGRAGPTRQRDGPGASAASAAAD